MNYPLLFRLLSVIVAAITAAQLLSLGVAFLYQYLDGGETQALRGLGLSIAISVAVGLILRLCSRGCDFKMHRKEALAVVGLGWIVASLLGAFPFVFVLGSSFADALFESTSGFTTTGASVYGNLEAMPRGLMFWRCISQWIGGLGIIVFFVAILSVLGAGAKILFSRESSASSTDLNSARVQTGLYHMLYVYLGFSALCAAAYRIVGLGWYDAVCHMFTTVSTAGFSTRTESIAAFQNPALEWTVTLFMFLAGISILVMLQFLRREWTVVRRNSELRGYVVILLGAIGVIYLTRIFQGDGGHLLDLARESFFQTTSLMTTTGYATVDYNAWIASTHSLLLALMVIGGCSGSTAGGIKVVRILLGTRVAMVHIERSFRARVVRSVRMNGRIIDHAAQEAIVTYLMLVFLVMIGSTIFVSLLEPTISFEGCRSAIEATLFNIGPGFAEFGPTKNFGPLSDVTKYYLSLLMVAGRLEFYAVLVLFAPALWRKFA